MRLDALLADAPEVVATVAPPGGAEVEITNITLDTSAVTAGMLFCCVRGARVDGHDLAADAVAAGAIALVVERPLPLAVPQVIVASVRQAMGPLAASLWGHPSQELTVVGVTGTSGKTTTTHLLASVLDAHGWETAVLGTLSGPRTTPEAPELQAFLAGERDRGRRAIAMEVSSHALAMGRVRATRFAVAVFTNLSHDHLDFHRDLEDYFETKAQLFTPAYTDVAVVNLDDPRGRELAQRQLVPTEGFSLLDVDALVVGAAQSSFRWRGEQVELALGGRFNVSNALAAGAAAAQLGIPISTIAAGLSAADPVPGRFEAVEEGQPFAVLVDYAHKPGALAGALEASRDARVTGRVIVVFGAGGDRDPSKRPEMGEVAGRLADRVFLTSDNPRSEDPRTIIDAIRAGMASEEALTVEPDRAAAITAALAEAQPGDVVLIAGKGHESVQVVGDVERPFDDRAVARQALRDLRASGQW